jgi:hypothetical protein
VSSCAEGGPSAIVGERAHQADIGGGEGVGFPVLAEGDIIRGPIADPPDRAQLFDGVLQASPRGEKRGVGVRAGQIGLE